MNGINVMTCVQTNQSGFRCVYGKESRMQQKYIMISRQDGQRRAASASASASRASRKSSTASVQNLPTGRDTGRTMQRTGAGAARGRQDQVQKARKDVQRRGQDSRGPGRTGRTAAGRRGSSFLLRTLVLAVIFAGMLAGFQMMTRASSREKEPNYKYYTAVTIGYGEDLSDIVYRYCDSSEYETADDYVRELCEINSLPYHKGSVPDLRAGTRIVVPYYSTVLK